MKKIIYCLGLTMMTISLFSNCGDNPIEKDAQKLADLKCKAQKIYGKLTSGDLSVINESNKLEFQVDSLSVEMEEKYSSEADKETFDKALSEAMNDCK